MTKYHFPSWLIVDLGHSPPIMQCERCSRSEQLIVPVPITDLTFQCKAFAELHKNCPPKAVP